MTEHLEHLSMEMTIRHDDQEKPRRFTATVEISGGLMRGEKAAGRGSSRAIAAQYATREIVERYQVVRRSRT